MTEEFKVDCKLIVWSP